MPLVNMRDMLYHAYNNNYAVGAFDLVSLDFLEAVIKAAETCRSSVILSVAEPHFSHYDFETFLPAVEAAAKRSSVPVAIQLDHGSSIESVQKAIQLGCNGVMLDASNLDLPKNIQATQAVVEMAHSCGIPVVGEVGYVAGLEGEGAELHPGKTALTNISEAKVYAQRTKIDFLAVSIGTVQGRVKGRVKLDFQRLKLLNQELNIPLVIHGGSGLNESQFRKLTTMGVVKIDYYTALSDIAVKAMSNQETSTSYTELTNGVKQAISEEVERCLRIWGSAGRAAEVLTQCSSWIPIEHLITHHVNRMSEQQANAIMAEGHKLLSAIPGVRTIYTGKNLQNDDQLSYCWIVYLTNQHALSSFLQHTNYREFSKNIINHPNFNDAKSSDYLAIS